MQTKLPKWQSYIMMKSSAIIAILFSSTLLTVNVRAQYLPTPYLFSDSGIVTEGIYWINLTNELEFANDTRDQKSIKQLVDEVFDCRIYDYRNTKILPKLPRIIYEGFRVLQDQGILISEEIEYYKKIADLFERAYSDQNFFIPLIYIEAGDKLLNNNEHEAAIAFFHLAKSSKYNSSDYYKGICWNKIGMCYNRLGMHKASEKSYQKAFDILRELNDPSTIGMIYNNLFVVQNSKQDYKKAEEYLFKALDEYSKDSLSSSNIAFVHNNLGNNFYAQNEFNQAYHYYSLANDHYLKLKTNSKELVYTYSNKARTLFKLHQIDSALYYCQKSIQANLASYHNHDYLSNPKPSTCISLPCLEASLSDKADYLLAKYQLSNSPDTLLLNIAYSALKISDSIHQLSLNSIDRINSMISLRDLYPEHDDTRIKLSLLLEQDDPMKVLTLCAIDHSKNKAHYNFSKKVTKQSNSLRLIENTQRERNQYFRDIVEGSDSLLITKHNLPIIKDTPLLLQKTTTASTIHAIQNELNKNQLIVSIGICDTLLILHYISKSEIFCTVRAEADIIYLIQNHIGNIKSVHHYFDSGERLFNALFKSDYGFIRNYKHLIIIPDQKFHQLPFETICLKKSTGDFIPLVMNHDISYASSILNLADTESQKSRKFDFIGLSPFADSLRNENNIRSSIGLTSVTFEPLPFTGAEIDEAAQIFIDQGHTASCFKNQAATGIEMLDNAQNARIIHIASHNFVDIKNPWNTFICFAPDTIFKRGFIYLPYVYYFNLDADLLVLSGCSTGIGKVSQTEGQLSIARGFSTNNVKNIILSSWKIVDETTKDFMVQFYRNLIHSNDIPYSLSQTKRQFIQSDYYFPIFWASFLHYQKGL
jgi:CHAT domain-containing protein